MTELETHYIAIRKKEGLLYSNEQVKKLPQVSPKDPHLKKWQMRQKSTDRLLKYLDARNKNNLTILDLGCGNGWFSAKMATNISSAKVTGWDINHIELKQAKNVFPMPNLSFAYQDIFDKTIPQKFDVIVINSVLQYFPEPSVLMNRLMDLLHPAGEIHILDSPFYQVNEVASAQERSKVYYKNLGIPEMADFYFHHTLKSLGERKYDIMYNPNQCYKKIFRKLGLVDSPFFWIKMTKNLHF